MVPERHERHLTVGTVRKPHGIRGELSVALETDQPEAVFRPGRTLLVGDAEGRPTGTELTVERSRPFKDGVLLKTVEHTARTDAVDDLRGRTLLIPEGEAEPLGADEIYYHELVGMDVVAGGRRIGTIDRVYEAPAGDLLAVRRPEGNELLVPFVRDWVREIRREEGVLELDPPEGLFEL